MKLWCSKESDVFLSWWRTMAVLFFNPWWSSSTRQQVFVYKTPSNMNSELQCSNSCCSNFNLGPSFMSFAVPLKHPAHWKVHGHTSDLCNLVTCLIIDYVHGFWWEGGRLNPVQRGVRVISSDASPPGRGNPELNDATDAQSNQTTVLQQTKGKTRQVLVQVFYQFRPGRLKSSPPGLSRNQEFHHPGCCYC